MGAFTQINEAAAIVNRLLDALVTFTPVPTGREGSDFRRTVGDMRADVRVTIRDGTLGTRMAACFTEAVAIGIGVSSLEQVLMAMRAERPVFPLSISVVTSGIVMAVAQQAAIVAGIDFVSRSDADTALQRMITTFDTVKVITAEALDSACYRAINDLGAALINHLYTTELRLPQIVTYTFGVLPSLTLANGIYGDATRAEELAAENRVVHPAFMPATIRALSA